MNTEHPECDAFPVGSNRYNICIGATDFPLARINAYRRKWGFDPLSDDGRERPERVVHNGNAERPAGSTNYLDRLGPGPGRELVILWAKWKASSCPSCFAMAQKMNKWGVGGCAEHIEEIVDDVFPRAKQAVMLEYPRLSAMTEGRLQDTAIRMVLTRDVKRAIKQAKASVNHAARGVPRSRHRPSHRTWEPRYSNAAVGRVDLSEATRHMMCHLWPVSGFGAWQWNCDMLMANADLFNGRRVIAIATDNSTDDPETVKEYLSEFTDEFIVVTNVPKKRECVTWVPMLERLYQYQGEQDVTFSCHGKCVRHKIGIDDPGTTVFRWTQAMYETCLNWEAVRPLLETHATVGSFRRYMTPQESSWGPWHYSGTFFWLRNKDAFARDWQTLVPKFFGTEAWPGRTFRTSESACLVGDKIGDLYKLDYWDMTVEPMLAKWREQHGITQ